MGLVNTQQAAVILGVSERRVRSMISSKQLPATKFSRDWLVDERELEKFAEKPRKPGRPPKPR
jgi:excisionase family DNA binding protein